MRAELRSRVEGRVQIVQGLVRILDLNLRIKAIGEFKAE
jgi:hypothetical protein